MLDDVKIAVGGRLPVGFYGRTGGMIPSPQEIAEAARAFLQEVG